MKKILIISSNRLGDSILSSGIIDFFKKKNNDSEITFVCGTVPYELFKYCENIDKIIALKKRKYSLHWFFLWTKVLFNFWDSIIDLRGTGLSFLLLSKNYFFNLRKKKNVVHKVKVASSLVREKIIEPKIMIEYRKDDYTKYFNQIKGLAKKKDIICIAPSANWVGKEWPRNRYRNLILKLSSSNLFRNSKFILLGSVNEAKNAEEIKNFFLKNEVINLSGKIKLNEVYLIMKESKLFIGNDSGLMHLAAASGIPTVGLFGPSDIKQYHPWGRKTLAITTPERPEKLMENRNFSHKETSSLMLSLKTNIVARKVINFFRKIKNKK